MSTNTTDSKQSTATGSAVSTARRRLLRGGMAVTPVVMTVASRPVLAQTCTTSSAFTSIGGSRQTTTVVCSGGTPNYWISRTGANGWPTGYLMQSGGQGSGKVATSFGSVFPGTTYYGDLSLLQVMQTGRAAMDRSGLAAFLVAAVLNAESGMTPAPIMTAGKARTIWSDYLTKGYYEPTAGVRWDSPQIISWLKTTMPLNG